MNLVDKKKLTIYKIHVKPPIHQPSPNRKKYVFGRKFYVPYFDVDAFMFIGLEKSIKF